MDAQKQPLLVICGPTATGKTALAVGLAKVFDAEVVSADSMQIYRGMDIGTAKPDAPETDGVPHHLIDAAEPWEDFSAAKWCEMAKACIADIARRGKLPIVAGGTGLYIKALLENISFAARPQDDEYRRSMQEFADKNGKEALLAKLSEVDPESALKLHPNDTKRIIRALEIFHITGRTAGEHDAASRGPELYDALTVGLDFYDRAVLYERIDRRVDLMVERGLEAEVRRLLDAGVPRSSTSMQAIGYKELASSIADGGSVFDAVEEIKRSSRRYAKRQLTWFRHDESVIWLKMRSPADLEDVKEKCITLIRNRFGLNERRFADNGQQS